MFKRIGKLIQNKFLKKKQKSWAIEQKIFKNKKKRVNMVNY